MWLNEPPVPVVAVVVVREPPVSIRYLPPGQTMHVTCPVLDWNVPAGQAGQDIEPVAIWKVPAIQLTQSEARLCNTEVVVVVPPPTSARYRPAAQLKHKEARLWFTDPPTPVVAVVVVKMPPASTRYEPPGQIVHATCPVLD